MKLIVIIIVALLIELCVSTSGKSMKCVSDSCQGCTNNPNCVWCDNHCIDKTYQLSCTTRITDKMNCNNNQNQPSTSGNQNQATTSGCTYKGHQYNCGDQFMEDCNTCTCENSGAVSCTTKTCNGNQPSTSGNENQPSTSGCNYKGQNYNCGDQFMEDCNTCTCENSGAVSCTTEVCNGNQNQPSTSGNQNQPSTSGNQNKPSTSCNYKGQNYNCGDQFMEDCNTCTCENSGAVSCTTKTCNGNQNQPSTSGNQNEQLCLSHSECSGTCYCYKESCSNTEHGVCTEMPGECSNQSDKVCGCDGMTYDNSCCAAKAGVNIECSGPCSGSN